MSACLPSVGLGACFQALVLLLHAGAAAFHGSSGPGLKLLEVRPIARVAAGRCLPPPVVVGATVTHTPRADAACLLSLWLVGSDARGVGCADGRACWVGLRDRCSSFRVCLFKPALNLPSILYLSIY